MPNASIAMISTGRRPNRSAILPITGPAKNCATAKTASIQPATRAADFERQSAELGHELRQDRHDDAEADNVDHHRGEHDRNRAMFEAGQHWKALDSPPA